MRVLFSLRRIRKVHPYIHLLKSVCEMSWLSSFVFYRSGGLSQWRYAHRTLEWHYPHGIWVNILNHRNNYLHMIVISKYHFKVFTFVQRCNIYLYNFVLTIDFLICHVSPSTFGSCALCSLTWKYSDNNGRHYSSVKPSAAEVLEGTYNFRCLLLVFFYLYLNEEEQW